MWSFPCDCGARRLKDRSEEGFPPNSDLESSDKYTGGTAFYRYGLTLQAHEKAAGDDSLLAIAFDSRSNVAYQAPPAAGAVAVAGWPRERKLVFRECVNEIGVPGSGKVQRCIVVVRAS